MPFDLCNSPAIFQKFINAVFKELIREGVVLTYMDDLIVPSEDISNGLDYFKRVLNTASEVGLIINRDKCNFLRRRMEYLGHIIENGRVRPSERKTEAVKSFRESTNIKQLLGFLELTSYFRKFIQSYSVIARRLTNLMKANTQFRFEEIERQAFNRLKIVLRSKPVLNLYRVGANTELHTDASMHGYGAILLEMSAEDNALHLVYFASGKTTLAEEKYPSYELEVLAIIKALKKFRVYLLGINFKIVTDCRAFALTMRKKDLCVRVARWALSLEELDYIIEHRPGRNMLHVDALSRNPIAACLLITKDENGMMVRLKKVQCEDDQLRAIIRMTEKGRVQDYVVRGGCSSGRQTMTSYWWYLGHCSRK